MMIAMVKPMLRTAIAGVVMCLNRRGMRDGADNCSQIAVSKRLTGAGELPGAFEEEALICSSSHLMYAKGYAIDGG